MLNSLHGKNTHLFCGQAAATGAEAARERIERSYGRSKYLRKSLYEGQQTEVNSHPHETNHLGSRTQENRGRATSKVGQSQGGKKIKATKQMNERARASVTPNGKSDPPHSSI